MKKLIVFLVIVLACTLLLASCGGESCSHENSRGGVCLDCGERFGFFKEYSITFVTPSGTTTEIYYAGEEITFPEIEAPEGSDFEGWYVYSDDGGKFLVSDGTEKTKKVTDILDFGDDGKITLTAVVTEKYWIINYVTSFGGGFSGSNPTRYKAGETVTITTEHTSNSGYDIQGWYFDEEFTQPATVISGKTEDITLYAKMYYLPFDTVTELDDGSVALSGLRPSYGPWNENGENTLIIPETYRGKTIASASVNANYKYLVIESKYCTVTNLPPNLQSVEVCDNHETYKSVDGSLYSKDGTVLYRLCLPTNAMIAEIPEGVTTIGSEAIRNTGLKSLTLPSTLTTIEQNFDSMSIQLFEIYNLSENLTLVKGSYDYGRIARYAYAIHTDKSAESIFAEINEFVFLNTDEAKTLMGYVGSDTVIALPESCNGARYDIYTYAFYHSNITEITVSAAVTKIGTHAFPSSLTKITFEGAGIEFDGIPFSAWYNKSESEVHVSSIEQWLTFTFAGTGSNPFCNNKAGLYIDGTLVTDVVIPEGASIPKYAFYDYQHLNSVTIGAGIEVIPSYAFAGSSVVTVVISDGVQKIETCAFGDCEKLATVELPSSIVSLGSDAFYGNDSFFEVADDGARYIGNWLVSASSDRIGDTVTIREGTVGIATGAISHSGIKTVTIPESVKYICSRAITGKNIEIVNYNATDAATDGQEIFYRAGMDGNGITVYIGATVKSIPANLFGGGLEPSMLYGTNAAKVKSVVFLGNAIKSIGDSAFRGAIYLESITLPNSLESIGNRAFYCCRALTTVNIPKNVKTISIMAFADCFALTSVHYCAIDATLETTGNPGWDSPFYAAASNVDVCVVTIGSDVTAIPDGLFSGTYFTSVVFEGGSKCTTIGEYAFYSSNRLVSVDLPDSVDTLGAYSFANCAGLTAINGAGLAYVHEKAISDSRNMPDDWGYEVYGNINYYFKTALEPVSNQITWARFKPGSVITDGFFQNCLKLQHVYIPEGCTVGAEMFKINSFSNIDKRLTLRVFFEDNDYEGTSAWRNIITHEGTEYKLGMVISVNGENTTLGTYKNNVSISGDGLAYTVDTRSTPPTATVLGYFAKSDSLTVGGTIDGYLVYDIDDYAFYMHDGISYVVVEAYEIGDMSFAASSIYSITLIGVDDVATGAFMACTKLHDATLGDVEEIGAYSFNGFTALAWIDISGSSEHNFFIRDYAFAGCTSLTEITLPANIYTIGTGAFLESGVAKVYTDASATEWYIIADAASTNPNIVTTYTVSTPENLAKALVTTYNSYYWANKAIMTQ